MTDVRLDALQTRVRRLKQHSITPETKQIESTVNWSCACGVDGFDIYDMATHANKVFADEPERSPMAPSEWGIFVDLTDLIREKMETEPTVIQFKETVEGGSGVVLYSRENSHDRYVVHRWAFEDTAGNPIRLLWSGGYYPTYERALEDFDKRRAT